MALQTEKLADMYKPDWVNSKVFKRALRAEADARKIPFHTLNLSSDEGTDEEEGHTTSVAAREGMSIASVKSPPPAAANSQDPDTATEFPIEYNRPELGIGFMKDYRK